MKWVIYIGCDVSITYTAWKGKLRITRMLLAKHWVSTNQTLQLMANEYIICLPGAILRLATLRPSPLLRRSWTCSGSVSQARASWQTFSASPANHCTPFAEQKCRFCSPQDGTSSASVPPTKSSQQDASLRPSQPAPLNSWPCSLIARQKAGRSIPKGIAAVGHAFLHEVILELLPHPEDFDVGIYERVGEVNDGLASCLC